MASPAELAIELGAPLGVVSSHVRMPRDYDCVELVRTEPVRGALQHFYKATARPNLDEDQWRTLPLELRRELTGETLAELISDLARAADARTLQNPEVVLTRTPLERDESGFKKLNRLRPCARAGARDRRRERGARLRRGPRDRARRPALQTGARSPCAGEGRSRRRLESSRV